MKKFIAIALTVGSLLPTYSAYARGNRSGNEQMQSRSERQVGDRVGHRRTRLDEYIRREEGSFHRYPGRDHFPRYGYCARHPRRCYWDAE